MVADHREAIVDEASAKLVGEGLRVLVGIGERNGSDVIAGQNVGHVSLLAKNQPIISPASAATIRLASDPASRARRPSLAIIGRWLGARLPVTAIWMAIDEKLAKPHSAKVTIARLRSESAAAGPAALPRSMKATNSFRTILVPNRPPATPASFHGMPLRYRTRENNTPRIASHHT